MEGECYMMSSSTHGELCLPSFFVVGAQKAGTTSLHHWLSQQHEISLPKNKETHFFSSNKEYAKGIKWYLKQFSADGGICGEVAPDYLFSEKTPERIHEFVPGAKLIFIFREPIQRAYSHYLMAVRNGYETHSFYDALLLESERMQEGEESSSRYSYLSRGIYSKQINRFKKYFSGDNCMFIKFDDLVSQEGSNTDLLRDVATFIGLDTSTVGVMEKNNPSSVPHSRLLRDSLYKPSKLKKIFRLLVPSHDLRATIAHKLDLLNQCPIAKPSMGVVPIEVVQAALSEVKVLQSLTGLELQDWLESIPSYDVD